MTEVAYSRHVSGRLALAYRGLYIYFVTFLFKELLLLCVLPPFHLVTALEQPRDVTTTARVPGQWQRACRLYQLMPNTRQSGYKPLPQ